jgi:hypothetical protein
MIKTIIGTCAAALISWPLALIPGEISQVESVRLGAVVKSDGLDIGVRAADCSQFAWPYYDSTCLHDSRRPGGEARKVRLVSPDQMPPRDPRAD